MMELHQLMEMGDVVTSASPVVAPQQPAPQADKSQRAFHNALRILMNVETEDLPFLNGEERLAFFRNPHLFFIRADDATCDRLWTLVQKRQPERYRGIV